MAIPAHDLFGCYDRDGQCYCPVHNRYRMKLNPDGSHECGVRGCPERIEPRKTSGDVSPMNINM